ncbi:MAG TPA: hypothetical protein VIM58_09910, partial [Candidatus Methylacidiphilales bacterium]
MNALRHPFSRAEAISAFSLVEVMIALAIGVFVLVGIMGLFTAGLQTNHQSEAEIQAANLASLILSSRRAAPLAAPQKGQG